MLLHERVESKRVRDALMVGINQWIRARVDVQKD